MILEMDQNVERILLEALRLVRNDHSLAALDALQLASSMSSVQDRKRASEAFQKAALKPEMGRGSSFQESIFERALLSVKMHQRIDPARKQAFSVKNQPTMASKGRNSGMVENKNNSSSTSRTKKFNVGDTFKTVALMGLQPVDPNRKPTCDYQLSRKTGRDGVMDLPEGTEITYVDVGEVYEEQTSSKRLIFRVSAGTPVILDGQHKTLEADIEIAGVVNHIDPDDPYNVRARENEAKREEKARLRTVVSKASQAA